MLSVAASSVAADADLMEFGFPALSPLREDIEGDLAICARCLFGLVC